jgi:hypothetical protein
VSLFVYVSPKSRGVVSQNYSLLHSLTHPYSYIHVRTVRLSQLQRLRVDLDGEAQRPAADSLHSTALHCIILPLPCRAVHGWLLRVGLSVRVCVLPGPRRRPRSHGRQLRDCCPLEALCVLRHAARGRPRHPELDR